jgi:putative ATPase
LFVDEIHRFNKAQQDVLLPYVEDGTVTLIGATTENPSFAVNAALLSRCRVVRLEPIAREELVGLQRRALEDADRRLSLDVVKAAQAAPGLRYDKKGDEHYGVVSAFIKSMRGSDADAAIYWMARMLEAGEDPLFVLRRMIVFASEDVGNADPRALMVAVAADEAFRRMGMPEGIHPMAQACTYLATAPKSNAAISAYHAAAADVQAHGALEVPMHLRPASTKLNRAEGFGAGYSYSHEEEGSFSALQRYLPTELEGSRYYAPRGVGYEAQIAQRLETWARRREEARAAAAAPTSSDSDEGDEGDTER